MPLCGCDACALIRMALCLQPCRSSGAIYGSGPSPAGVYECLPSTDACVQVHWNPPAYSHLAMVEGGVDRTGSDFAMHSPFSLVLCFTTCKKKKHSRTTHAPRPDPDLLNAIVALFFISNFSGCQIDSVVSSSMEHGCLHSAASPQGGKKIALRGGDGTEAHLPNPPLHLLGRRAGRGVWAGAALPAVPGGGGGATPTYMAQNDPHVALIILTTHMWGKIFE